MPFAIPLWLLRLWPYVAAVGAIMAVLWGVYRAGENVVYARWNAATVAANTARHTANTDAAIGAVKLHSDLAVRVVRFQLLNAAAKKAVENEPNPLYRSVDCSLPRGVREARDTLRGVGVSGNPPRHP